MQEASNADEFLTQDTSVEHPPGVTDRPIRIALVGAGAVAQTAHLPAYRRLRKGEQLAFAWRIRNGVAEVFESGRLRKSTSISVGATLSIAIVNGRVQFLKSGQLVYASGARVPYPLVVQAVLIGSSSSVAGATLKGGNVTVR